MELISNAQITNMRSSLVMTHFLNLTYSLSGSKISWLSTSTTASVITTNSDAGVSYEQIPNQAPLDLKSQRSRIIKDNSEVEILEIFNKYFSTVIDPVIIATGIVGNALLALVFMITQLRLQPLSHVLSCLGVVDLIYMLSYLLMYLTKQGVNVYGFPAACQILNFTLMLTKCMEAWYILLSHLNRLKAHTNFGSEKQVFPTKFAIIMVGLLVAAPLLHILWSMETITILSTTYCIPMRETIFVHLTLRKIELVGAVLLPLVLISGVDFVLLVKVISSCITKEDGKKDIEKDQYLNAMPTSSCPKRDSLKLLQNDDHIKDKQLEDGVNDGDKSVNEDKDLTLAFQITSSLVKETSSSCRYDSIDFSQDRSLTTNAQLKTLPKIIFTTTSHSDINARLSTPTSQPTEAVTEECNRRLSILNNQNCNLSKSSTSMIMEKLHIEEVSNRTDSVIDLNTNCSENNIKSLRKNSAEQYERKIICNSNISTLRESKIWNKPRLVVPNFVFSGLKKCQLSTNVGFSKETTCKRELYKHSSSHFCKDNTNRTYTASQIGRYECASQMSTLTRNLDTREDQVTSSDSTASTIATVIMGLVFAVTILPSTYTHAVRLFLESPTSRPTAKAVQKAILFESFVQINAFYKLFMYALVMPSFRSAFVWLLNHWIKNKISRISNLCLWGSGTKRTETVYV